MATMDLSPIVDYSVAPALSAPNADMGGMMIPDCRVILSVSVHHPSPGARPYFFISNRSTSRLPPTT